MWGAEYLRAHSAVLFFRAVAIARTDVISNYSVSRQWYGGDYSYIDIRSYCRVS